MTIVLDPPSSPPVEAPGEDASSLWEILYEATGFHRDTDEATGFQLQKLCEALCGPYQPIYDLVRERDGQKGWAVLLDPDECPAQWLDFLSQWVGVIPQPQMIEEQLRAEIRHPTSWKRGESESIELVARRGQKVESGEAAWIRIRPRTPSAGHTYIRTLLSETPDPTRKERELREATPAWELLDYEAIEGVTYADVAAGWKTYAKLKEAFSTYKDLAHALPDELP